MNTNEDEMDDAGLDSMQLEGVEDGSEETNHASWWSLFSFTSKSHSNTLITAIILAIASGIIAPVLAIIFGRIFKAFTSYGATQINRSELVEQVSRYGVGLVVLGCTNGLLNAAFFASWLIFGEMQARRAREVLFDSMLYKDMAWFDSHKVGMETLVSRLQTRIRELQMAMSQPLGFLIQYTATGIAALVVALYYSWALTLVTLGGTPISIFVLGWMSKGMQHCIEGQANGLTKASKLTTYAILGIETVKTCHGQEFELSSYAEAIASAAKFHRQQLHVSALQMGFIRFAVLAMFVQGFWYGNYLANVGQKTPGDVLTCFWACLIATQTVERIVPELTFLEKGRAAGATLKAVVLTRIGLEGRSEISGTMAPKSCEGQIEMHQVSFSYPSRPDQSALKRSNFHFAKGKTTFVIGKSGSGKSTLANLLIRLYEHASGKILIDGNLIEDLDVSWLRENITLVQQQSILFNQTVFDNIVCGKVNQSAIGRGDVGGALKMACLEHVIRGMPEGLNTFVGAGGSAISGGQRQRVVLARARVRDAPVLILDEATSALDDVTKQKVLKQVREWRKDRTTIIITHDLSQTRDDDYIYVMDDGVVVQEGLRSMLEQKSGPFNGLKKILTEATSSNKEGLHSYAMIHAVSSSHPPTTSQKKPTANFGPPQSFSSTRSKRWSLWFSTKKREVYRRRSAEKDIEMEALLEDSENVPSERLSLDVQDSSAPMNNDQRRQSKLINSKGRDEEVHITPLKDVLATVWPALTSRQRAILVLGFSFAFIHAAAIPVFSLFFSQLLSAFYLPTRSEQSHQALFYSLSILSIAVVDSVASYYMYYLLECSGQAWVDNLRTRAYENILNQPFTFFSEDHNNTNILVETLDRKAEETRNLLGRFAGIIFVSTTMMLLATTFSLTLSWRLTLVTLACTPLISLTTRTSTQVSTHWETKSNASATAAHAIFSETITHIRSIRAFTLEPSAHTRHTLATTATYRTGLRRAFYTSLFHGLSELTLPLLTALLFTYGAHLTPNPQSTTPTLTLFTTLLFTLSHIKALTSQIPHLSHSLTLASPLTPTPPSLLPPQPPTSTTSPPT